MVKRSRRDDLHNNAQLMMTNIAEIVQTQQLQPIALNPEECLLHKYTLETYKSCQSIQLRAVIHRIIDSEMERKRKEKAAWRVGAGLLGLMFGMGDGLGLEDMYQAMAFSTAGGYAHGVFSDENRELLKEIDFDWVHGDESPLVIEQRLGRAVSRLVIPFEDKLGLFSIRKGCRGVYLTGPLRVARFACPAFTDDEQFELMKKNYSSQELTLLGNQLFPMDMAHKTKSVRMIRWEETEQEIEPIKEIARSLNYEPVVIETNNDRLFGLRTEIPTHSDY